jgi:hypothetical protein
MTNHNFPSVLHRGHGVVNYKLVHAIPDTALKSCRFTTKIPFVKKNIRTYYLQAKKYFNYSTWFVYG